MLMSNVLEKAALVEDREDYRNWFVPGIVPMFLWLGLTASAEALRNTDILFYSVLFIAVALGNFVRLWVNHFQPARVRNWLKLHGVNARGLKRNDYLALCDGEAVEVNGQKTLQYDYDEQVLVLS
jgi:hypothetical protein